MLKRRKVETRKQYEKRKRRRQFAISALCGVEDTLPQPLHRSYWSKPQSPVSPYVKESDAALEIYDRHAAQTINKRRRPRGRSELYRQFEVNLSSSSSSCQTESAHTLSVSDGVLSNDESMLSLSQKQERKSVQQSGVNAVESKNKRNVIALGAPHEAAAHRLVAPVLQKTAPSEENLGSKISKGLQTGVGYLCCNTWNQARVINLRSGPGMSLTEEKQLWRIALEGEKGIHCKREPSLHKGQIREIEVIPVDQTFQTTGAINYAEMEGIGMVFAPALLHKAPLSPSSAPVPWWKRDSWIGLMNDDRHCQQDQSAARTSANTKKASNKRSIPLTRVDEAPRQKETSIPIAREERKNYEPIEIRPVTIDLTDHDDSSSDAQDMIDSTLQKEHSVAVDVKRGKKVIIKDISFSDLDESLDQRIVRVSEARNQQVKLEAFQLAKSRGHQPLQTFNAKPGRRKGSADPGAKDLIQEIARPIYIPTLNHTYHDPVLDVSTKRPERHLVTCESESRIGSESDLSSLVRQLDSTQKSQTASRKPSLKSDLHMNADPGTNHSVVKGVGGSTSPLLNALLAESRDSVSIDTATLPENGSDYAQQQAGTNQTRKTDQRNPRARLEQVSELHDRGEATSVSDRVVDNYSVVNDHFKQDNQGSIPTGGTRQPMFSIDPPGSPRIQMISTNICQSPHLVPKAPAATETKPRFGNNPQSPIQLHGDSSVLSHENVSSVQRVASRNMGSDRHFNQSRRARNSESCKHIDLTSCLSQLRTRSKSPVRLYGDPPFPVRMDGSPVREGLCFEQTKPSCNQDETECNYLRDSFVPRRDLQELACSQQNRINLSSSLTALNPLASWLKADNPVPIFIKPEGFNFEDDSLTASPWMKSLDHEMIIDDDSMTDELQQLEASEELLRKELSEIQLKREKLRMPTVVRTNNSLTIDCTRCAINSSPFPERHENCPNPPGRHLNDRLLQREVRPVNASQMEGLSTDDASMNEIVDVTALSSTSTVDEAGLISNIIDLVLAEGMGLDDDGLDNFLPIVEHVHQDNASCDNIEVVFAEDGIPTYPACRAINQSVRIPSSSVGPRSQAISPGIHSPETHQYNDSPRNLFMSNSHCDELSERILVSSVLKRELKSPIDSIQYNGASQRTLSYSMKSDLRSPLDSTQYSGLIRRSLNPTVKCDLRSPMSSALYSSASQRAMSAADVMSPISSTQYSGVSQCALNSRDMLKVESCDSCADTALGISPRYDSNLEPVQREVDESEGEESLRDSDGRFYPYFAEQTSPRERGGFAQDSNSAKHGGGRFLDGVLVPSPYAVDTVGNVGESIVDRELSWQSVEQLYQLSPQVDDFERYGRNQGRNAARSSGTFLASEWDISPNAPLRHLSNLVSDARGDRSSANSAPNVVGLNASEDDGDKILALRACNAHLQTRLAIQGVESPVVGLVKVTDGLYSSASFESDLQESRRIDYRKNPPNWEPASESPTASRAHSSPLYSAYVETRYHLETDDETDTLHSVDVSSTSVSSQELQDDESESCCSPDVRCDERYDMDTKVSKCTPPSQDLDARRHLQSLKQRHQHLYYRDHNQKGTLLPSVAHNNKVRFNLNTDIQNPLPTDDAPSDAKSGYDRNKRLGRLKKFQSRKYPSVNERAQAEVKTQPKVQLRNGTRTGVGLPGAFTEQYGLSSNRKPLVSNSNVNSGLLVEVYMPIIGAPLGGETKDLKKNADRATRDHSIASSTTRSRELVHALPSSAKSRNVAAAKPGSLLWQATAARDRF